jgi:hypothetical protein
MRYVGLQTQGTEFFELHTMPEDGISATGERTGFHVLARSMPSVV